MTRVERFHPGTKVSNWASGSIASPLPTTYIDYSGYLALGGSGTSIDKFSFFDDSRSTLAVGLSNSRNEIGPSGCADSGVAGYQGGGRTSSGDTAGSTVVDKFSFADDSRTTHSLSYGGIATGGMANSGTAGYWAGGWAYVSGWDNKDDISKLTFSSDTSSTLSAVLSVNRYNAAGFANSGTAGYFAGGGVITGSKQSVVNKLTFSTDAVSTLGTGLSNVSNYGSGMANSGTAGYVALAHTGSISAVVDKFAFSNDARTTLGTGLSSARYGVGGMADSGVGRGLSA